MEKKGYSLYAAYDWVKTKRPCIAPNKLFFQNLVDFEHQLCIKLFGSAHPSMTMVDYDCFQLSSVTGKSVHECTVVMKASGNDVNVALSKLFSL